MQKRSVLLHSSFIKEAVTALPARFGLAFGAACCQRVLPLFAASAGDADRKLAADYLEKVWRWLSDLDDSPGDWSEVFEQFLPGGKVAEEIQSECQSALLFHGLAGYVAENRSAEVWRISDGCLALVDRNLYRSLALPVSGDNDRIIDNHPLMRQAMEREKEDLELLGSRKIKSVFTIWMRSKEQHLLSV